MGGGLGWQKNVWGSGAWEKELLGNGAAGKSTVEVHE